MRVLVFGTFDLLHPGHLSVFEQARALHDRVELHAVVARDATVEVVKGLAPVDDENERVKNVASFVDRAHLGSFGDKYVLIEQIRPDIIALGYDQTHFVDSLQSVLASRGFEPRIVRLKAYMPEIFKSSLLRGFTSDSSV
ncbi:MAG: adenylyltransferase/cytidyltransferase family protein [Candidatus Woesearchaeota archaeon]